MDFHEVFRKFSLNLVKIKTRELTLGLLLEMILLMNKIVLIFMNFTILFIPRNTISHKINFHVLII